MKINLSHTLQFLLLRCIGGLVRLLPFHWVQSLGAMVGGFAHRVVRLRRRVIVQNLRNAFPDDSPDHIDRIALGSFRIITAALFEFLWFPNWNRQKLAAHVRLRNPEVVTELLKQNKGIILLTLHFGSWEMFALGSNVLLGTPIHLIVKTQSNRLVDTDVNAWRTKFGSITVPMEQSIRHMLRALSQGQIILLAADQTAAKESIRVLFFERETPCHEGPAVFALKSGAPLVFGYALKREDGSYEIEYREIPTNDLLGGASPGNVRILTERHTRAAEELIRRYPEQWMWMHKRWKHVADRPEIGWGS